MISSKRRRTLFFALAALLLYIFCVKMNEPYSEISRLEGEVYELKRRNVLRMLHEQNEQEAAAAGAGAVISPEEEGRVNDEERRSRLAPPFSASTAQIHLPNIIDIYPHLVETTELASLNPALRYPDRQLPRRKLIMGVPTINRGNVSYLLPTLGQLFGKARTEDLELLRVVVMISDVNGPTSKFVQDTLNAVKDRFNDEIDSGLLQVIVPPAAWYPNLHALKPTFNDRDDRMFWRTKQNLDYAYLMIYAARMGELYLQLEDDIEAAPDYTATIIDYAARPNWFILELSTLGYIGKLMRSSDIPSLAVHILLNYLYKPIDWLLSDYCTNRYCSPEMPQRMCAKEVSKYRQQIKPSAFQHVGYYSSLSGKIQKLKDKTFRARPNNRVLRPRGPSGNPDAKIYTTLTAYQTYTLDMMYSGDNFAWLVDPQENDSITIDFTLPKKVTSVTIRTGAEDHREDIFTGATELLAVFADDSKEQRLARFEKNGTLSYRRSDPPRLVEKLIVRVGEALRHWVIIDELRIEYVRDS